jgi:hypothetical protein
MFPFTLTSFGQVLSPSAGVSNLLVTRLTPLQVLVRSRSFEEDSRPIFWTPHLSRESISPTWSHRHSPLTRLMPSSFTIILHRRVSPKFFVNGMKNVGMHLSDGRSLHGFSSSNCYHTSFHPLCAGWIETQDLFFEKYKFEQFIEVGPSLTLAGMAVRTLKANDDSSGRVRRIFCDSKDQKDIYYQFDDEPEATPEQGTSVAAANLAPASVPAAPAVNAALLLLPALLPASRMYQFAQVTFLLLSSHRS